MLNARWVMIQCLAGTTEQISKLQAEECTAAVVLGAGELRKGGASCEETCQITHCDTTHFTCCSGHFGQMQLMPSLCGCTTKELTYA